MTALTVFAVGMSIACVLLAIAYWMQFRENEKLNKEIYNVSWVPNPKPGRWEESIVFIVIANAGDNTTLNNYVASLEKDDYKFCKEATQTGVLAFKKLTFIPSKDSENESNEAL